MEAERRSRHPGRGSFMLESKWLQWSEGIRLGGERERKGLRTGHASVGFILC